MWESETGERTLTHAIKQRLVNGSPMLWWFHGDIQRSLPAPAQGCIGMTAGRLVGQQEHKSHVNMAIGA